MWTKQNKGFQIQIKLLGESSGELFGAVAQVGRN